MVLLSSCGPSMRPQERVDAPSSHPPLQNEDIGWKSGLFPSINKQTKLAGLSPLEGVKLSPNNIEVRIWHGFGLFVPQGLIMKRIDGQWFAKLTASSSQKIGQPKSGWEPCWIRLTNAGLLKLPDATQLGKEPVDPDVLSYVVELNVGGEYRTYHYTYPEASEHEEAKQMIQIGEIIADEFGLPQFKTRV